jgi:hypothetical protein
MYTLYLYLFMVDFIKIRSRFDSLTRLNSACLVKIVGADICFDVFHKMKTQKKVNTKTQKFVLLTHRPRMWLIAFATRKGDRFELTRVRTSAIRVARKRAQRWGLLVGQVVAPSPNWVN